LGWGGEGGEPGEGEVVVLLAAAPRGNASPVPSSVTILLMAKRIVCSVVAAPIVSPAPVT
jgi:hypothetical protein